MWCHATPRGFVAKKLVMPSESDYEVVQKSLRSPGVFGEIFQRQGGPVYRYVRRRVGEDVASDLTAEVFTRAFRDRHRFDGRSESTLPWLLGIATNVVRMNARGERRRLRAYAQGHRGPKRRRARVIHRVASQRLRP